MNQTCKAGVCVGGHKKDCSAFTFPCSVGVCESIGPGVSRCYSRPDSNAFSCDADQNGCTMSDGCNWGTCWPGPPIDCSELNDACNVGTCASTGSNNYKCVKNPVPKEGASCDADSNGCTVADSCVAGTCVAGKAPLCGDACNEGQCLSTGKASYECTTKAEPRQGAACDDGNPCTVNDHCDAGLCVAGAANPCDDDNPCTGDSCDETGCRHALLAAWATCGEGRACFAAGCEALAQNDRCETATPLLPDVSQTIDISGYHAFRTVPAACAQREITGPDAFFAFAYEAGKAYTLRVSPNSATDVALVLWGDCSPETCLATAQAGAAGEAETLAIAAHTTAGTLVVQVVSLAQTRKQEAQAVVIRAQELVDDGDAELDDKSEEIEELTTDMDVDANPLLDDDPDAAREDDLEPEVEGAKEQEVDADQRLDGDPDAAREDDLEPEAEGTKEQDIDADQRLDGDPDAAREDDLEPEAEGTKEQDIDADPRLDGDSDALDAESAVEQESDDGKGCRSASGQSDLLLLLSVLGLWAIMRRRLA